MDGFIGVALKVLGSDFFWGVVVGLLLSLFGGWMLAKFSVSLMQRQQKKTIVTFCIDAVKNLQAIIADMDNTRDRTKAIHHDFLALIDVEISVYGRNREHLIHLPEDLRNQVRKFMNDCAIKRAEVVSKLDQFYRLNALADQIQAQGRGPEAERARGSASGPLKDAQDAADRLVKVASGASELLTKLESLAY